MGEREARGGLGEEETYSYCMQNYMYYVIQKEKEKLQGNVFRTSESQNYFGQQVQENMRGENRGIWKVISTPLYPTK